MRHKKEGLGLKMAAGKAFPLSLTKEKKNKAIFKICFWPK
jgi:hypothetical protein